MRLIILLFLALLLQGCWALGMSGHAQKAGIFYQPPTPGDYPPYYLMGWKDGCQTGAASSADNVYKYRRLFTQDWRLAQDDTYYQGWKDSYDHCRKYFLKQDSSTGYTAG